VLRAARLVLLAALLASCRSVPTAVPLADDPRPARLLARWQAETRGRTALRGRAHLSVDGEVRIRADQVIALERPARMRIEVKGLLNQTAAVIATDGDRFEVYRTGDRTYDSGPVRDDLLWREAYIALSPREAVALLLGDPIPHADLVPRAAEAVGSDRIRMDLWGGDPPRLHRVAFDDEARLREYARLSADGGVLWQARFDGYEDVAGAPVAHHIELDVGTGGTHVEISLRDVELDPTLDPAIFRLRASARGPGPAGGAG
jgi:hypothetical protein